MNITAPDHIRQALRYAAEWLTTNRPDKPMSEVGRRGAALLTAQETHPNNQQATNKLVEELLTHMPQVAPGALTRTQYGKQLLNATRSA
ncbi:hypothetical protein OG462_09175 [Streptomyces sp. NBC_01077]|uniref:hypothetical protein n=1 Tax=Streptomyces sp. NBC_01077 TaxID=2903746 RepID=UPI003864B436|nr:hypothetical protein OG462_09175 [Streptomyces sp. NBC_01077]